MYNIYMCYTRIVDANHSNIKQYLRTMCITRRRATLNRAGCYEVFPKYKTWDEGLLSSWLLIEVSEDRLHLSR
jgi:hypothetical protein